MNPDDATCYYCAQLDVTTRLERRRAFALSRLQGADRYRPQFGNHVSPRRSGGGNQAEVVLRPALEGRGAAGDRGPAAVVLDHRARWIEGRKGNIFVFRGHAAAR